MAVQYLTYLGRKRLLQLAVLVFIILFILFLPSSTLRYSSSTIISHILSYRIHSPSVLEVEGYKLSHLALRQLYANTEYQPVWVGDKGPNHRANSFLRCLQNSYRDGLNPEDYRLHVLQGLWKERIPERLAQLDLLLSDLFMQYARDMYQGRVVPQSVDKDWFLNLPALDMQQLFEQASVEESVCHSIFLLRPKHPQYARLRQALAEYRQIQQQGGWSSIPLGRLLKSGMEDAQVPLIRRRLVISGDYFGTTSDNLIFDEVLSEAVKNFQSRHGIYTDGMVGDETRVAMSIPVEKRIAQIQANMERWRWVPRHLGHRYIVVNAAGYELEVIEDEERVLSMRVVVGKRDRPTPVFTSELQFVDFNPTWNVPHSIAVRDILPKLQKDPGFTKKQNMQILSGWNQNEHEVNPYDIDWQWYSDKHFPFHLRQPPGPNNPLGSIRFLFPNSHEIYLHDTNHAELFDLPERNYSSGCIRVQKPLNLARYLLKDDANWSRQKIRSQIDTGKSLRSQLGRTLPVYILYFTAWVDEDGRPYFYQDAYQRDRELLLEMGVPTY
ncbi:MAG: L,D-transpeptidase family protein [Gammaproteobacteria bacterium]|nr:L,D-transpeptidase family protein [Gammaproteobacteria bacterium]